MKTFMVVCSFRPEVRWDDVTALVAAEQEVAKELRDQGLISAIRVSVARDKVFIEVSAEDKDGALAIVRRLPMAVFWDLEGYEIASPIPAQ